MRSTHEHEAPGSYNAPLMGRTATLLDLAAAVAPGAIDLRREIHRHPETAWDETNTTRLAAEALRASGLEPRIRDDGIGLWVDVGTGDPKIAFRSDLDALPLHEATGLEFSSVNPGVMHACGHDVHTAVGVGIAIALHCMDPLPGAVRMLFQPAEEHIPGGALTMVNEGLASGIDTIAAFHVDPTMPPGTIGLRSGPITGAADRVVVRLFGPGGHTSRPHQTVDLVAVAAHIVLTVPELLRRTIDPREPLAIVFGRITGGRADNVVPSEIEMGGTIRLFNLDVWRDMPKRIEEVIVDVAATHGAQVEVEYLRGSPPVVNHPAVIDAFAVAGRAILGRDAVRPSHQSLGSEDFSWFLESARGALIRLGCAVDGPTVDLHSPTFDADEQCIEPGIAIGAGAILELMQVGALER